MSASSATQCPIMPYGASVPLTITPTDGKLAEVRLKLNFENPVKQLRITATATRNFGAPYDNFYSPLDGELHQFKISVKGPKDLATLFTATLTFQDPSSEHGNGELSTGFYPPPTTERLRFELKTIASEQPDVVREVPVDLSKRSPEAHIYLSLGNNGTGFYVASPPEREEEPGCVSRVYTKLTRFVDEALAGTHPDASIGQGPGSKKDH